MEIRGIPASDFSAAHVTVFKATIARACDQVESEDVQEVVATAASR